MSHNENEDKRWKHKKEQILLGSGLGLIMASFVNADILGNTFHPEFVLAGLALCGIGIAQWFDRK